MKEDKTNHGRHNPKGNRNKNSSNKLKYKRNQRRKHKKNNQTIRI